MVLVERETGLPLDLVVLINSFLYERLTDENFYQAIALWFENKEECQFRFGHISDWNTSRVTNMRYAFSGRCDFNEDIGRWNVGNVTKKRFMFCRASQFNQDIGQWDVSNVTDMKGMFQEASQFNQDIGQWDVSRVTNIRWIFSDATSYEGVRWPQALEVKPDLNFFHQLLQQCLALCKHFLLLCFSVRIGYSALLDLAIICLFS
jgi:surface protein